MKRKHEYRPFFIPAGSELPIDFYVANVGKWPIITPYEKKVGSRVQTPLVQCEAFQDEKDYVYKIQVTPAPDESGLTSVDIEVNVYPQNIR